VLKLCVLMFKSDVCRCVTAMFVDCLQRVLLSFEICSSMCKSDVCRLFDECCMYVYVYVEYVLLGLFILRKSTYMFMYVLAYSEIHMSRQFHSTAPLGFQTRMHELSSTLNRRRFVLDHVLK
jgi:hypothetical protein